MRRLASSSVAVITTSSARISVFLVQPFQACGISSTISGALRWAVSMISVKASGVEIIDAVERRGSGQQRQVLRALGQQPIEIDLVDALRRKHSLGNALRGILVEIDVGRAEWQGPGPPRPPRTRTASTSLQATLWAMVDEPTPPLAPMKAIERPIGSASGSMKMPEITLTMSAIEIGATTYSEMPERISSR